MQNHTNPSSFARAVAAFAIIAAIVIGSQVAGCGKASVSGPQIPPSVLCKLSALKGLPSDPEAIAVRDVIDLVGRVKACDAPVGDAGAP